MTPDEQRDLDEVCSLTDAEVAEELRAAGADPEEIGKAGAAIALLAGRNHRLTAQLAEAERARDRLTARTILCTRQIARLLDCAYAVRDLAACDEERIVAEVEKHLAEYDALTSAALTAVQTATARESAENTAEETMTNRCDTKQGPCACGAWHDAQTPEPVEPSDEELEHIFNAGADDIVYASGPDGEELPDTRATVANGHRALYRAGLAAEAAARAETRRELETACHWAVKSDAELERVRAELATEKSVASQAETDHVKSVRETRRLLDDIAIALHGWSADTCKTYVPGQLASLAASLRAQARARRVPTREAIADAICGATLPSKEKPGEGSFAPMLRAADAVLRLFAEAPPVDEPLVTSSNEPPVPLPEVLPVGTRSRHGSVSDTSVCLRTERGSHAYWGRWNLVIGKEQCVPAEDIDWSHYRAQQRAAEPTPWKPTVGERAVLVASPDPADALYVGRDGVLVERPRDWVRNALEDERQAFAFVPTGNNAAIGIHRDATWRPASAAPAKGELKDGDEVPCETCRYTGTIGANERCPDCNGMGYTQHRAPAEPSPQPGGELDALTRRVEESEVQLRVQARLLELYSGFITSPQPFFIDRARIEREERERGQSSSP